MVNRIRIWKLINWACESRASGFGYERGQFFGQFTFAAIKYIHTVVVAGAVASFTWKHVLCQTTTSPKSFIFLCNLWITSAVHFFHQIHLLGPTECAYYLCCGRCGSPNRSSDMSTIQICFISYWIDYSKLYREKVEFRFGLVLILFSFFFQNHFSSTSSFLNCTII